jgi:hypothetical protein
MAKVAASPFPAFQLPAPKLPKLDLDTLFARQKASLATAQEAQTILDDAAQAIARVQHDYLEQTVAAAGAALGRKELAKPEAVLAEVKIAAERTCATTQQVVDLAVAAQRRIGALATQRTQANVSELKALAA